MYKNTKMKNKKNENVNDNINIKISEKKAQTILEEGGMLDAYKYLIIQLCKNGLPTGNLFEYSAYVIKNYEKKWKEKKSKIIKEKVEKFWEEKEKKVKDEILKNKNNKEKEKILNRSLDNIQMKNYIKSLDRSRSTRSIKKPRVKPMETEEDNKINISTVKNKKNNGKNLLYFFLIWILIWNFYYLKKY